MTISTQSNRADFTGNGSSTAFPFTFKAFSASDLSVIETVIATGVSSVLASPADYSVALTSGGGEVTLAAALAVGKRLAIIRIVPTTQTTAVPNQGPFPASNIEERFDRLAAGIQQLDERSKRSLRLSEGDVDPATGLPSVSPTLQGKAFLGSGDRVLFLGDSGLDVASSLTISAVETLAGISGQIVTVAGDSADIQVVAADLNGADTIGAVASLISSGTPGFVSVASPGVANVRTFTAGSGIAISNPTGASGNPQITLDAELVDITNVTPSDGVFIVGDGSNFVGESGDTALTSLGAGTVGLQLFKDNTAADARNELGLGTGQSPTFVGLTVDDLDVDGITFEPTGAVVGQALGFPNSATTLEPYTPAGGGDTLKAANETITGDWTFAGDVTITDPAAFRTNLEVSRAFYTVHARDYGAVSDLIDRADGAITAGSATFDSASSNFTDADAGKTIAIAGAGSGGTSGLITTIAARVSATQVTLAATAATTVSAARFTYGTDNTAALQAAINTARHVYIQRGRYLTNGTLTSTTLGQRFFGDGSNYSNIQCVAETGSALVVRNRTTGFKGLWISGSWNRRLHGSVNAHGIEWGNADVSSGASSMSHGWVDDVFVERHSGIGFYMLAAIFQHTTIRDLMCNENAAHGFLYDDGTYAGYTNKQVGGIIHFNTVTANANGGEGFAVGNPGSSAEPYRIDATQIECVNNGWNAATRFYDAQAYFKGATVTVINSAYGDPGFASTTTTQGFPRPGKGAPGRPFVLDGVNIGVFTAQRFIDVEPALITGACSGISIIEPKHINSPAPQAAFSFEIGADVNDWFIRSPFQGGSANLVSSLSKNGRYVHRSDDFLPLVEAPNNPFKISPDSFASRAIISGVLRVFETRVSVVGEDDVADSVSNIFTQGTSVPPAGVEVYIRNPKAYAITLATGGNIITQTGVAETLAAGQTAVCVSDGTNMRLTNVLSFVSLTGVQTISSKTHAGTFQPHSERSFATGSLPDDEVYEVGFTGATQATLIIGGNTSSAPPAIVAFRTGDGSAYATLLAGNSANVAAGVGALTNGTSDGVDGKLNINVDTTLNRVYIKNRTAGARAWAGSFLATIAGGTLS